MKEIRFVDVGEGITEGHIQKWLVNDGDQVSEDETILQVETDKAVVNVPSPIDGTVRIVAKEDSIVHVGDLIAQIGTEQELKSAPQSVQQAASAPAKQPAPQQQKAQVQQHPAEVMATPYVRKLARDLNIDISKIVGTGPGGRVIEEDLRKSINEGAAPAAPAAPTAPAPQKQTTQQPAAQPAPKNEGDVERIPMSQTRKAIARNMENSWTIPRATHMDLINATNLFNLVSKEKQKVEKERGIHLTFYPFIIKAVVAALKENPNFNSSLDRERMEIIKKNYYNIGLAAEATDGLKVIVIKDADKKTILELANEIKQLSDKVKNQTITLQEMQDSTFTITNIGSLGGGFLSVPMINYPNVAILGVHIIRDWPVVEDGMIKVGKIMPFSLVFDHRVVDGAEAVKFGNTLIKYLEDPDLLEML